ncbi:MaoC family dehydratase [Streptomyces sp. Inha503]|uniref:MaoC family dehydratase n=1 Tax=Streptomyces sp. Inha503 TaxID=3383314 RepID=UPI0039A259E7
MSFHFGDLKEGARYRSSGRTLTEADIMSFAGLSGDYNPLHIDETWVRSNTEFDGRIAHGLLVLAVTSGLRTPGLDEWAILAYLNVERKMLAPAYPGDTIHQRSWIESLRASRSRPGTGIVVVSSQVINHRGEVLQEGKDTYLVGGEGVAP